jgi:uncharacterized protein YbbC (DUF1343 family)
MKNVLVTLLLLQLIIFPRAIHCQVINGADRTGLYLPLIRNKNVAIVANPSSVIGQVNIVDSLLKCGIRVVKVFSPEHGFRSFSEEGKVVKNRIDSATSLPVISLYGKKKKPESEDLSDVDLVLFDLQDVGVRCYTYLSTLAYVMEAAAENRIPMILLDRPNPNGFYIDGPVMDSALFSFVGMHPVPLVYGMTIGEYAQMVNEEGWLKGGILCELQVIRLENYSHSTRCSLACPPSPNLKTMNAIYLYPSLCLFEGTNISVGRGTPFPFEVFGNPQLKGYPFSFTPLQKNNSSYVPLYNGDLCFGLDLRHALEQQPSLNGRLNLLWVRSAFQDQGQDPKIFNSFFDKLAGNTLLRQQIINGLPEKEIRDSWKEKIELFKEIRNRHLLYLE